MTWGQPGSWIVAQAPSNIALIKYMGKVDSDLNLPANGSLSLTLDELCSVADLRILSSAESEHGDRWLPEAPARTHGRGRAEVPKLDVKGSDRILKQVDRVRRLGPAVLAAAGIPVLANALDLRFELRTSNTFPAQAGIASSASSFAAVTLATLGALAADPVQVASRLGEDAEFRRAVATLARQGSGSSCRSLEGPWVRWQGEHAEGVGGVSGFPALSDLVCVVGREAKAVSSSAAHRRVLSSPLWAGRVERANARLQGLEHALKSGDRAAAERIAWDEFWEMHSLFHTSQPPFTYWEPGSVALLKWLQPAFDDTLAGQLAPRLKSLPRPIVTMDAGANVHLLVEQGSENAWKFAVQERFPGMEILQDSQGKGGRVLAWGDSLRTLAAQECPT